MIQSKLSSSQLGKDSAQLTYRGTTRRQARWVGLTGLALIAVILLLFGSGPAQARDTVAQPPVVGEAESITAVLPAAASAGVDLLQVVLPAVPAVQAPILGTIEGIVIDNPADIWSGGTITVTGQNVILPRNLLIDLPANRLTLQQLFTQAPPGCAPTQTGLAVADTCPGAAPGVASILANRLPDGRIIAGEVFIQKGTAGVAEGLVPTTVSGIITYIDYIAGYFRVNGVMGDPNTGVMVRINDPDGRHTIQQGLGCATGPNCSADPRFTLDPDNYTFTFSTGYPACIPSTTARTGTLGSSAGSDANGVGDALCPDTNRPAPGSTEVVDSTRFAPIQLGDFITAEGNFEKINLVRFFSAHTAMIGTALTTRDSPDQPDYMFFDEVEWDVAGFQNERVRLLLIGFSTLGDSQLDAFALHVDPATNQNHEYPLGSTVGNPDTIFQGLPGLGPGINQGAGIFKIRFDVDFLFGVRPLLSPCTNLFSAGFVGFLSAGVPPFCTLGDEFSVLSPISRELIGRTRHKATLNPGVFTLDINGNEGTNGQYLTPVGVGHPEFVEINLNKIPTPFIFGGLPWNVDRRLGPGGCDGPCEDPATVPLGALALDPFPYSELDPRTQASVPASARDRILSYHPFGPGDVLDWPPFNLPPVANDDTAFAIENPAATIIDVIANDTDPNGTADIDPTTVQIVTPPANGVATANVDGTVTYAPNVSFLSPPDDSFTYTVDDTSGATSNIATVNISVQPTGFNVAPVANDDTASTAPGTPVTINVIANDSDADGTIDPTTVTIGGPLLPPGKGTIVNNLDGTVTFTPNALFNTGGTDSFTYTVKDNDGTSSNEATVTVTVDVISIVSALCRSDRSEWRVRGTSSIPGPGNTITIRIGSPFSPTILGTAPVDDLGDWRFTERNSPNNCAPLISVESTAGATLGPVSVTVK